MEKRIQYLSQLAMSHEPKQTVSMEDDVEEAAFGYVIMENGATIILEVTWALNTTDTAGIRYMVCGSEAGVDRCYSGQR